MVSINRTKNVLIATAAGLLMIFLIPGVLTGHAMASSSHLTPEKRYNDGYNNGYDWYANHPSDGASNCDPEQLYTSGNGHTQIYCNGWSDGYRAASNNNSGNSYNSGTQQEQNSNVNVHGNNNDVTVNQGQSANSGNSFDGHHHSSSSSDGGGSGNLPNCHVICIG